MVNSWPKNVSTAEISVKDIEVLMRSYGESKCTNVRVARAYLRKVGGLNIRPKDGVIINK